MEENTLNLFTNIGLTEQKAKETIKNEALSKNLKEIIELVMNLLYDAIYFSYSRNIACLFHVSKFQLCLFFFWLIKF